MLSAIRRRFSKVKSLRDAMHPVTSGQTILSGGFGCCGVPNMLIKYPIDSPSRRALCPPIAY